MELLIALATKFWQWSLLILFVIIGFLINLLDKRKSNITFKYEEMPQLKPIPIKTKGKGFWKGIAMWLLSTRNWELTKNWRYNINGTENYMCTIWICLNDVFANNPDCFNIFVNSTIKHFWNL